MYIPVIYNNKPLMPTKPSRARKWIKSGKATGFWNKGVFCVRLNIEPSGFSLSPVVCGIDPGSKKEAYTVKSDNKTYLNIQSDTVTWVKDKVEARRNARHTRRQRKTPYRKCRFNRKIGSIPPSTKARWQLKLRVLNWLKKIFPITDIVVEDIKAKTKENQRRWNKGFSPLEVGKTWFYSEIEKLGNLHLFAGYETKAMRDYHGLKKSTHKMSNRFESHCVDSWCLAHEVVGTDSVVDNKDILLVVPFNFFRRQLHVFNPAKGGKRRLYGGMKSLGFKRGSLVKHIKYGLCYLGGTSKGLISLHGLLGGRRLCQNAKTSDIKFLTYSSWRCEASSPP